MSQLYIVLIHNGIMQCGVNAYMAKQTLNLFDGHTFVEAMGAWRDDYADMRRFFIYGESLEFDALMQKMRELQERVRVM